MILNILYNVIEKLLRQLESQGEIVNQQKMLIHQLLSKFPLEVIVKLEDVKKCLFCRDQHFNDECEQYKSLADRKQKLLSFGQCFLCFKTGHTFRECPLIQKSVCYYCGKRGHHNGAICLEKFGDKEKEKVENVFVTSKVSERSSDNTKHGQLN